MQGVKSFQLQWKKTTPKGIGHSARSAITVLSFELASSQQLEALGTAGLGRGSITASSPLLGSWQPDSLPTGPKPGAWDRQAIGKGTVAAPHPV